MVGGEIFWLLNEQVTIFGLFMLDVVASRVSVVVKIQP